MVSPSYWLGKTSGEDHIFKIVMPRQFPPRPNTQMLTVFLLDEARYDTLAYFRRSNKAF